MVKQIRIEFPFALYHVASRGNWGMDIFKDNQDRESFLEILSKVIERYNWICHGYCLMDNHYHLLIETPDSNLSDGMKQLGGVYARKSNRRYSRRGHLFQGRYRAILVQEDEHFLELIRYLAFNPVKVGMVRYPGEWNWGSYSLIVSGRTPPSFLNVEFSLSFFSPGRQKAKNLLMEFVEGKSADLEYPGENGEILVFGGPSFKEEVFSLIPPEETFADVPRKQRFISRPSLDEIFSGVNDKQSRNIKINEAVVNHGYKLREVSDRLGIHYSTISKILKSF